MESDCVSLNLICNPFSAPHRRATKRHAAGTGWQTLWKSGLFWRVGRVEVWNLNTIFYFATRVKGKGLGVGEKCASFRFHEYFNKISSHLCVKFMKMSNIAVNSFNFYARAFRWRRTGVGPVVARGAWSVKNYNLFAGGSDIQAVCWRKFWAEWSWRYKQVASIFYTLDNYYESVEFAGTELTTVSLKFGYFKYSFF